MLLFKSFLSLVNTLLAVLRLALSNGDQTDQLYVHIRLLPLNRLLLAKQLFYPQVCMHQSREDSKKAII